jgi:hypothetical protein
MGYESGDFEIEPCTCYTEGFRNEASGAREWRWGLAWRRQGEVGSIIGRYAYNMPCIFYVVTC